MVGRRCPPDGSEELATPDDLVDHGGDVVLPDPAAEEGEVALAGVIRREQLDEMPSKHRLGRHRRRECELSLEAMVWRNLGEQLLDIVDADGVEERLSKLGCRVRHIRVRAHAATFATSVLPGATWTRR